MISDRTSPAEVARETRRSTVDLILAGVVLIAVSVVIPEGPVSGYFKELAKEVGVVIASAFSIKLVYEQRLADKHFDVVIERLRRLLEQGDSNGAECAKLGIVKIFQTRDRYEEAWPLQQLVTQATAGARFRIVGLTLFLLATKQHVIKKGLQQGGHWELCFLNPAPLPHLANVPHMTAGDLSATIERFVQLTTWLKEQKPTGSLELRIHEVALFDSYSILPFPDGNLGAWDLNFGPDVTQKRILLLEPDKALGRDLGERYDRVWTGSTCVFLYRDGQIVDDGLATLVPMAHGEVSPNQVLEPTARTS